MRRRSRRRTLCLMSYVDCRVFEIDGEVLCLCRAFLIAGFDRIEMSLRLDAIEYMQTSFFWPSALTSSEVTG